MSLRIKKTFSKKSKFPVFVSYLTAGYPKGTTVDCLLAMEASGCDVLELGIPFSDPIADGKVIQRSSFKALELGTLAGFYPDSVSYHITIPNHTTHS